MNEPRKKTSQSIAVHRFPSFSNIDRQHYGSENPPFPVLMESTETCRNGLRENPDRSCPGLDSICRAECPGIYRGPGRPKGVSLACGGRRASWGGYFARSGTSAGMTAPAPRLHSRRQVGARRVPGFPEGSARKATSEKPLACEATGATTKMALPALVDSRTALDTHTPFKRSLVP